MKLGLLLENTNLLLEMKNTVEDEIEFLQARDLNRTYVFWSGDIKNKLTGREIVDRLKKYNPSAPADQIAQKEFGGIPEQDIDFLGGKRANRVKAKLTKTEADEIALAELAKDMRLIRKTRQLKKDRQGQP